MRAQAILKGYFDPPPGMGGPVQPTEAHHALAALCASGRVRVILTTNFDRLIERALDQAGIPPQLIATPSDVAGMTPLAHAAASVVKLHGDYATSAMRNTAQELAAYPEEFVELLSRALDEYGLLVVGWSADHDVALAQAIAGCPSRRYPTHWASFRGSLTESAGRLIAARGAAEIDTASADEFLVDLTRRIDRLDELAGAPRTSDAATNLLLAATSLVPSARVDAPSALAVARRRGRCSDHRFLWLHRPVSEGIYAALGTTPLTGRLRDLSSAAIPASASGADTARPATAQPVTEWGPTPAGHQTTEDASYRLGGDGSSDVCALATIHLPNVGSREAQ